MGGSFALTKIYDSTEIVRSGVLLQYSESNLLPVHADDAWLS